MLAYDLRSSEDVVADDPQGRALRELRQRLERELDRYDRETIASLVDAAFARTRNAPVQLYRVVLAERAVRAELHRRSTTS